MERRRRNAPGTKPRSPSRTGAASKRRSEPATAHADSPHFKHIEALIDGEGEITVGRIGPVSCGATAADGDQALAMLVRRKGETLLQLVARLDEAIRKAYEDDIFIDEINPP